MSKLRVAIFGCGRMGTLRARSARKWGAEVCAVFDINPARSRELADSIAPCRAATVPSPANWSDLDAVFVCTPPSERGPVREALERGLPTFMEKPVGLSASDAVGIARLAAARNIPTAVGFMNRYRASVKLVLERLQSQTILGASANWVNGVYMVPWWTRTDQSGGSLNEQASHFVDLTCFLLGQPISVYAVATPHPEHPQLAGNAVLALSFPNGILASLYYSCCAVVKAIGFRIFTSREEICLSGWDLNLTNSEDDRLLTCTPTDRYAIFDIETAGFLDAVSRHNPETILCDLADGLRTQRVLDAAARALADGYPQDLSTEPGL